jgi:hypothetical protein
MSVCTAILAAIIGKNRIDRYSQSLVEGEYIIVYDRHSSLWVLSGMQKTKRIASERINYCMQVDTANTLEGTDKKCILAQELPWTALSTCRSLKLGFCFSMKAI